ncbi:hypothetical protein INT43_005066 [Umbelopsis isabellina]|uniref:Uncharacterized protein n=1 Tax=Mortierella isabellina TaxID=91625 RepID=A0A8H7UBC1_MORIS|nr:hypothetical protein INT43_005066 [Umbelopsis isabellina]
MGSYTLLRQLRAFSPSAIRYKIYESQCSPTVAATVYAAPAPAPASEICLRLCYPVPNNCPEGTLQKKLGDCYTCCITR